MCVLCVHKYWWHGQLELTGLGGGAWDGRAISSLFDHPSSLFDHPLNLIFAKEPHNKYIFRLVQYAVLERF